MKNIDEIIAVLAAYKEGKKIQFKIPHGWVLMDNSNFNFSGFEYRIAPEPKLIPFDYNDDLVGKVVKAKHFDYRGMIIAQDKFRCDIKLDRLTYQILLDDFTFLDGKPCGKYE